MNLVDCIQGDAVWFKCRLGCVTSSRVADAIAKRKRVKEGEKSEELAGRRRVRFELMCELLSQKPAAHYVSEWMDQGREREPIARIEYENATGASVEQVGFVYHPTIKMAGCSPDGIVGDDGLLEIKCPKIETHLQYLIDDIVPEAYLPQLLWQMACCERQWVDFVSYHPDMPEEYQLFIKRLERTKEVDAVIRGMELEVVQLLAEVDEEIERVKSRKVLVPLGQ
jgi:predicted phage-related endonuclease